MSTPTLHAFLAATAQNPELLEKVRVLVEKPSAEAVEQLTALAANAGFPVSAEEWQAALTGNGENAEIEDGELESLAGGAWVGGSNVAETLTKILRERRARPDA